MGLQQFAINVALTVVWALLQQSASFATLLTGYTLGAVIIYLTCRTSGTPFYLNRALRAVELTAVFIVEVVKANVKVAYQVLHPALPVEPGFFSFPLQLKTEGQITLLALLITMTPGTLSVDISPDGRHLVIHALDVSDPEGAKADIRDTFERRILEVFA